jgi:hypothetical protein
MGVFVLFCVHFTAFEILERFNANKYAWYLSGAVFAYIGAVIFAVIFRKEG